MVDCVGDDLTILNCPSVSFGAPKTEITDADGTTIQHLIEQGQTGALRHCSAMFKIKAPFFVAKEHMGLAGWNCNEINKGYANANTKFYEPQVYREHHQHGYEQRLINPVLQNKVKLARFRVYRTSRAMQLHHAASLDLYRHMIEAGVCREQAAGILPQNVYVEYYAAATLDTMLAFTDLVGDEYVLPEIQEVATAVLKMLQEKFPISTEKWQNTTKKRKATVERRLTKLNKVLAISANLNDEQVEKLKDVKQQLLEIIEKTEKKKTNEDSVSEEGSGSGNPQVSEKTGSEA